MAMERRGHLGVVLGALLTIAAVRAAPTGQTTHLVTGILSSLTGNVNRSSAHGGHSVQKDSFEKTVVVPGGSAATVGKTTAASTPGGKETSGSVALATGAADPGRGGLSATVGAVGGGAGTGKHRAASDATALIGSIAVKDGKISTSTAIVATRGDSSKGTETEAIGLTASEGHSGKAKGAQLAGSKTSPASKGSSQADLTIGSSVGDIGTQVTVAGGSEATKKEPFKHNTGGSGGIYHKSAVDRAKELLYHSAQTHKRHHPVIVTKDPHVDGGSHGKSGGGVKSKSHTENQINLAGPSASEGGLVVKASSPSGKETSHSVVLGSSSADPGPGGLSASVTTTGGGGGTGHGRAGTDAVLLTGSIALNSNGEFSTSTGIVKTSGDTKTGTKTDALALTNSVGHGGAAHGIQSTSAKTGSAQESTSQGEVTIGSKAGNVGTSVSVTGGTQTIKSKH